MSRPEFILVTGRNGLRGIIETPSFQHDYLAASANAQPLNLLSASGESLVLWLDNGERRCVPHAALEVQEDGTYQLSCGLDDLELAVDESAGTAQPDYVLPVIAEQLELSRRRVVTGKVRISKSTRQRTETVDQPLIQETLDTMRVAVNRLVDTPPSVRQEGDTTIIPVLEEVLVVEKRLLLKEELHITRRRVATGSPEQIVLRYEEVLVERFPGQGVDTAQV